MERLHEATQLLGNFCLYPRVATGEAPLSSFGVRERQTTLGRLIATQLRRWHHADLCMWPGRHIIGHKQYPLGFTLSDLLTEFPPPPPPTFSNPTSSFSSSLSSTTRPSPLTTTS